MRIYPLETANPNVPKNVFFIAEASQMSGEIITTYFINQEGWMLKVGDWSMDKPQLVFFPEVYRITGDTPNIITGRWESWKRQNNVIG